MTTQREWLDGLAAAADDLHYFIVSIEPRKITLDRFPGPITVTIESVLLNGQLLRTLLRPQLATGEKP